MRLEIVGIGESESEEVVAGWVAAIDLVASGRTGGEGANGFGTSSSSDSESLSSEVSSSLSESEDDGGGIGDGGACLGLILYLLNRYDSGDVSDRGDWLERRLRSRSLFAAMSCLLSKPTPGLRMPPKSGKFFGISMVVWERSKREQRASLKVRKGKHRKSRLGNRRPA